MDSQTNLGGWVVGAIIVLLILAGLWWAFSSSTGGLTSKTATTTPQTATTTSSSSQSVTKESRTSSTVAAVVAGLGDASRFQSLIVSTGVSASLTGKGPYTVFVPINEAFGNVSPTLISSMTAVQKKRLVQYHVVSGKALDIDAISSGKYTALSKDVLNFIVDLTNGSAFVNSGLAIKQYKASNGTVYLISAILIPPQPAAPGTKTN